MPDKKPKQEAETDAGRKPVSYDLIRDDSIAGRAMYAMCNEIVEEHHEEVINARIALAWALTWKPDVDGHVKLGQMKKASDLDRELHPFDFVCLLNAEWWQDGRVTDAQRRALLDHELCVPPWVRVSGPQVEAAISRRYAGKLVRIRTASGHETSVTENHPVLTPRGFVRADALVEGEEIFSGAWPQREAPRVDPDVGDVQPTIEQVARTRGLVSRLVPETTEHLDGQVAGEDVDVEGTDSYLKATAHAGALQHGGQTTLVARDAVLVKLTRLRRLLLRIGGVVLATPRHVSGDGIRSGPRGIVLRPQGLGLGQGSRLDPQPMKPSPDQGRVLAQLGCERDGRHPALVALDQIVRIFREPFDGHVFNLQTATSWYAADGIVTHNCHCAVKLDKDGEPALDSKDRVIYRLRKHDIEEFSEIVARHGCYKRDLEHFAAALRRAPAPRQRTIDDVAPPPPVGPLTDALRRLAPKPGSEITSVTIEAGGQSVTLTQEDRARMDSDARKGTH